MTQPSGPTDGPLLRRIGKRVSTRQASKERETEEANAPLVWQSVKDPVQRVYLPIVTSVSDGPSGTGANTDLPVSGEQGHAPLDKESQVIFNELVRAFPEIKGATNLVVK